MSVGANPQFRYKLPLAMSSAPEPDQRIDKWLWAARFFKTRSLASEAADGGKIRVNGARAKPAKIIHPGDTVEFPIGELHWTVTVRALSKQRLPAAQARLLYEETEDSRLQREAQIESGKLSSEPATDMKGRPTKRDRRRMQRFFG